jgi:sulfite oxidase
MKQRMEESAMAGDLRARLRRRELLVGAGAALAGAPLLGGRALAQAPGGKREGGLLERTRRPPNLEAPVDVFTTRITPIERFYMRNHFDLPSRQTVDPAAWRLSVEGLVDAPLSLSLTELEAMPQVTVEAVLQCSGNGRGLFVPRIPGVQWGKGAMGNARWTGVRLADVLARARPRGDAMYVELQGADRPAMQTTPAFIRGIPMTKALHEDTLVALRMNDVALPLAHGFPARLVVPGWVADDWMKWLTRIHLRADEPGGFFFEKAYRFPIEPGPPGAPVGKTVTMERMVVKSIIGAPTGPILAPGRHELKGVAFSGEAEIVRVDVSVDSGRSWQSAALESGGRYGFTVFSLPFDATLGPMRLMSRATDSRGAVQPASPVWNPAGYLHHAIDVVELEVRA